MEIKQKLQELNVKRDSWNSILEERIKRKQEIEKELETILNTQMFVQAVAENVQSQLSSKVDNIVNLGLQTCFPGYTFEMKYVPSRGKTEVLFIVKDGEDVIDPMNQCGGGLINILELCLRVAVFAISSVNNVMCFDEPGKFISEGLRERFSIILKTLSEKLNLQIIEVTHIEELAENSDNKIMIVKKEGVSNVEKE